MPSRQIDEFLQKGNRKKIDLSSGQTWVIGRRDEGHLAALIPNIVHVVLKQKQIHNMPFLKIDILKRLIEYSRVQSLYIVQSF